MAKVHTSWTVLAHGPVEPLADNLWRVEGAVPGMSLRRVMTVARRGDGGLVVHNAIALDEPGMAALEGRGAVAFLLVPNGFHRLDAPAFKARYAGARVLCPSAARAKVGEVVAVDGAYEDFPADGAVRLEPLRGVAGREGAMIVRSADGATVVLNDVMFNMPEKPRDAMGWLMTTVMGSAPGPRVSRLSRFALVSDRVALRDHMLELAETPGLVRLIVSHGAVARGPDAAAALRSAAGSL